MKTLFCWGSLVAILILPAIPASWQLSTAGKIERKKTDVRNRNHRK